MGTDSGKQGKESYLVKNGDHYITSVEITDRKRKEGDRSARSGHYVKVADREKQGKEDRPAMFGGHQVEITDRKVVLRHNTFTPKDARSEKGDLFVYRLDVEAKAQYYPGAAHNTREKYDICETVSQGTLGENISKGTIGYNDGKKLFIFGLGGVDKVVEEGGRGKGIMFSGPCDLVTPPEGMMEKMDVSSPFGQYFIGLTGILVKNPKVEFDRGSKGLLVHYIEQLRQQK